MLVFLCSLLHLLLLSCDDASLVENLLFWLISNKSRFYVLRTDGHQLHRKAVSLCFASDLSFLCLFCCWFRFVLFCYTILSAPVFCSLFPAIYIYFFLCPFPSLGLPFFFFILYLLCQCISFSALSASLPFVILFFPPLSLFFSL